jgi:N-acyl homoserine lactone hydrolase
VKGIVGCPESDALDARPERLYLPQLEAMSVPTPGGPLEMALGCYVITTGDGRNSLIDSGVAPGYPRPATAAADGVRTVIDCLSDIGLTPHDIDTLTCTHFDVDHAGCHDAFTGAEFVVWRVHYEAARNGYPRCAGIPLRQS